MSVLGLGTGLLGQLSDMASAPRRATLRLPQTGLTSAAHCDSLGQPGAPLPVTDGGVSVEVPARGVAGIALRY